eukprot:symbB.v1.2.005673.t1/scaffold333.1/size228503/7
MRGEEGTHLSSGYSKALRPQLPTVTNKFVRIAMAAPETMEMKVSTKKDPGFFFRAARVFLQGAEEKEGLPARRPVDELKVSGLGEAIKVAVNLCTRLEGEGLAIIDGAWKPEVYAAKTMGAVMPPKGKAKVQKPPAAPAGSGVEAARRLKAKLEKFYREVEGIPWSSKLGVPLSYEERGCEIPDCAERAVTLEPW